MYKIAIIEDDRKLCRELASLLEQNGYQAESLKEEEYHVEGVLGRTVDLLLLDLGLPGTDGLYLCRELRRRTQLPVVVITSQDTQMAELMSMNVGADDFITKPFHPQILLAHVEAVLRRAYREPEKAQERRLGGFTLNVGKGTVSSGGGTAELTKNEMRILDCLARHKNEIVSREELMEYLWDSDLFVDDNTLTVNVTRLRGKLHSIGIEDVVQTKRGLGYMLVCDTESI